MNRRIYRLTRKFPKDEMYAMASQLRRASTSVSSNMAEGSGRNSDKDFAHFLEQAYGSLMEVASLLYLAMDEQYIAENEIDDALDEIERLAKRTASLNRSLIVDKSKTPFARRHTAGARPRALDPRPSTLD